MIRYNFLRKLCENLEPQQDGEQERIIVSFYQFSELLLPNIVQFHSADLYPNIAVFLLCNHRYVIIVM